MSFSPELESVIAEVKDRLPDYLHATHGDKIDQRKSRAESLWLSCPYHSEKTASFNATRYNGEWRWQCFGACSCGGSTIDASMKDAGARDFYSGLKHACLVLNITLPDTEPPTSQELARYRQKQRQRAIEAKARKNNATQQQATCRAIQSKLYDYLKPHTRDDWKGSARELCPPERNLCACDDFNSMNHDEIAYWLIFLTFEPQGVIWMGDVKDSGEPRHSKHFKPSKEWWSDASKFPRVSFSYYQQDSYSRSLENVSESPYILIESDDIIGKEPETQEDKEQNKRLSMALFHFMQERLGMKCKAIIDTGNKSLHAWFFTPPHDELLSLQSIAESLGIDKQALANSNAPLRMPNFPHEKTGRNSELLFLNIDNPFQNNSVTL